MTKLRTSRRAESKLHGWGKVRKTENSKNVVMDGVKIENLEEIENQRIPKSTRTRRFVKKRYCASQSSKGSQRTVVIEGRDIGSSWRRQSRCSSALMMSQAKNCSGLKRVKLVNKN